MFGNREELAKPLKTNLVLTILGSENDQNIMKSFFLEPIDQIYSNRLTINSLSSIDEFKIEKRQLRNPMDSGLINMNWVTKTTSTRPSVFIIIKQLQSETFARDIERQWIKEIQTIHQSLPETIIYLIILTGTFPMIADTGDSENLVRLKDINKLFNFISLEAIKKSTDARKLHMNIINSAKDYYKTLKQKFKKKVSEFSIKTEQKVKYNMKIGVISLIKNRTVKSKYFEEAYQLLYNYNDMTKYYYGQNQLLNFSEIRAAADWFFFQIHKINKKKKDISKDAFIIKANQHLNKFSHNMFIDPNTLEAPLFNFFDQYWGYIFNEFVGEETASSMRSVVLSQNFTGHYFLKGLYCLIRMIQQLPQFENITLNTVVINDKKFPIEALKRVQSKFYEKPATYSDFKDFLTPKHYGFNIDLYLRYFILDNNLNHTNLNHIIRQSVSPKIIKAFESKTNQLIDISFYLTSLNLDFALSDEMKNDILNLYDILLSSKHLWKYPLVYYDYLNKINDIWMNMPQLSLQDKERLMKNIVLVGNYRDLTQKEEEYLLKLMNDQEVKESSNFIKNPIKLKVNDEYDSANRLFNFDYTIPGGNTTKNILESAEFEFTISTCIATPIKFNSITIFFAYDKRFKKFTSFENELTRSTPICFTHRILLKSNEKALIVKCVKFELEGFPFVFEYKLYSKKERVVLVKQKKKNLLEFKVPQNVKIGVNEFYNIHCEIVKDDSVNVDIGYMSIDFERSHTISDLIVKPIPAVTPSVIQPTTTISSFLSSSTQPLKAPSNSMRSTFEQMMNASQSSIQTTNLGITSTQPVTQSMQLTHTSEPRIEIQPEFFVKDPEGALISKADKVSFKIENFETSNKTASFLVKFSEIGRYTIGFNARYKIMKQEVTDDQIESKEFGKISFEIIYPFEIRYELNASHYMTMNKQKIFNVNSKIKMNLIIVNQLDDDGIIDSIIINKPNEDIGISTPLEEILTLPQEVKESIVTMMKSCWYTIPFEVSSIKEYNGGLGSVGINWVTQSLKRYSNYSINCNKFDLPDINILAFSFEFFYTIPKEIELNSEFNLIISFQNKEKQFKRIIFLIDNSDHWVLNGLLKKKIMLYPNEKKELSIGLIPLTQGKIKLPPCKIMEYPIQKYESKTNSIYYFPDSIIVKQK